MPLGDFLRNDAVELEISIITREIMLVEFSGKVVDKEIIC